MRLIEKGNPARRRAARRKRVAIPALGFDIGDPESYEWDGPVGLTKAEMAECWARVAQSAQQIADDARKLAEQYEREKVRRELIAAVASLIPKGHERQPKNRDRVVRRIAERVVSRTLGVK